MVTLRKPLLPLVLLLVFAGGSDFPPIPPLPASSWPAAADAVPFARALVAGVSPDAAAQKLIDDPAAMPAILRNLGTALMSGDAAIARYASAVGRAASAKTNDARLLSAIAVVDPLRYGEDAAFRKRIDSILPSTLSGMKHAANVLDELNASAPLSFDVSESIAAAAHLVPRVSVERRSAFDRTKLTFPDDIAPIRATIYSLSTSFFSTDEALRFLDAVHRASPQRRLIVLGDAPMRRALAPLHVTFIDTFARPFTPWPRDPFLVARANESLVFVNRPNVQPDREEDQNMVRAIVDALPEPSRWSVSPVPFHNGNVLLTPSTVWITIHALEPRALAILGIDRVPVESFAKPAGVERYVAAVRQAAEELRAFYRKPVRFVHSMPAGGSQEVMTRLGGGAGFDLDSIVTILPKDDGSADALVADVDLGVRVARDAPASQWSEVRRAYGVRDDVPRIIDSQGRPETLALQAFLNDVAAELRRDGLHVLRLPLLVLPQTLFTRDLPAPVLLTWNNVVLERGGRERRAEGFASLLGSADELARREFAVSGYRLELLPPLIRSIELGGGYRCASNHVR